jgi:hypothetical protein
MIQIEELLKKKSYMLTGCVVVVGRVVLTLTDSPEEN